MKRITSCVLWLGWSLLSPAGTLDRIAATVDKHVISERDVLADIRISAFLDGRQLDAGSFSGAAKRAAADRLIDQYLVLQDAAVTRAPTASAADTEPLTAAIRARFSSDAEYGTALAKAGITAAELSNHLLAGLKMLRYTDLRFRPEAQVTDDAVRAYYDKLASQGANGDQPPLRSFEDSRQQIENLLTERQVMDSLDRWLIMARSESRIIYRDAVFEDALPLGAVAP